MIAEKLVGERGRGSSVTCGGLEGKQLMGKRGGGGGGWGSSGG